MGGYYPPARSRPLGVAILSILVGIYGFLVFLAGLLVLAGVAVSPYLGISQLGGYTGVVLGLIVVVIGLIILGVAVALWRLRLWALVLAVIVTLIELAIYGLAHDFLSLGFILSLIVFVYLIAVSRHFF
jgi:hypothetical protein